MIVLWVKLSLEDDFIILGLFFILDGVFWGVEWLSTVYKDGYLLFVFIFWSFLAIGLIEIEVIDQ